MYNRIKKFFGKKEKYYPKEECGIVGIYNVEEAANFAYLGIYALQHRGQESAGIVTSNGHSLHRFAGMGKVSEIFRESKLKQLLGTAAIAHNRYSTTGASFLRNAQPIRMESRFGSIALAHNGNISNAWSIRQQLENEGSIFQSTIDTEIIFHLMAKSDETDLTKALISALAMVKGAYSLVILTKDTLYVARDPHGFRPLVMGKKDNGLVFASETCALDIMGAEYIREIEPGEFVKVDKSGMSTVFPFPSSRNNMCIFEYIYFARPDSQIFSKSVYDIRYNLGRNLAREFPIQADKVIAVPDSSTIAALGYSAESGIPFHMGLIRSHYIGRTFIEPSQKIRDFGAKLKYNSIESVIKGKKIIVVDDSIMRGTTQKKIIKMLRKAGAKEIHIRISCPPTIFPCYFGIDIPTKRELIAATHTIDEICKYLQVDSLAYLSHDGMLEAVQDDNNHCTACFNGNYPISIDDTHKQEYQNQKMLFDEYGIEEQP